jgi:hypothetical protein
MTDAAPYADLVERLGIAADDYVKAEIGDDAIMLDIGFAHGHQFSAAKTAIESLTARNADLLAALKYMVDVFYKDPESGQSMQHAAIEQAQDAIERATS